MWAIMMTTLIPVSVGNTVLQVPDQSLTIPFHIEVAISCGAALAQHVEAALYAGLALAMAPFHMPALFA